MKGSRYTLEQYPAILDQLARIQWEMNQSVECSPGSGIVNCVKEYAKTRGYGFDEIDASQPELDVKPYDRKTIIIVDNVVTIKTAVNVNKLAYKNALYLFLHPPCTVLPEMKLSYIECAIVPSPLYPAQTIEL